MKLRLLIVMCWWGSFSAGASNSLESIETVSTDLPAFGQQIMQVEPLVAFGSTTSDLTSFAGLSALPNTVTGPIDSHSLKSVRQAQTTGSNPYKDLIQFYALQNGLDYRLLDAVIRHESNYQADAVSPAGAKGLMQIMDDLIHVFNINPFDPEQNIRTGSYYLSQLLKQFNHDLPKALAAYNAGPGRVMQYDGIPPFPETQTYVNKILHDLGVQP